MCLRYAFDIADDAKSGIGYKWLNQCDDTRLETPYVKYPVVIGEENCAVGLAMMHAHNGTVYSPGFHIYTSKSDAIRSAWKTPFPRYESPVLAKVSYRNAHTYGADGSSSGTGNLCVVVAQYMTVLEIVGSGHKCAGL